MLHEPFQLPLASLMPYQHLLFAFKNEESRVEWAVAPIPNQNGGRVWVSQVPINQADFAGLVNTRNARGPVTILTGTHGGPNGGFGNAALRELSFFRQDVGVWANTPRVSVINVNGLGASQLVQLANGEGRVILAWCDSERAGRILRAIGYLP
ncbi:MAG: hypothetical protein K2X00_12370 [Nitrospiraceae bacterium]|nr:hypothetical protein [Nitrospiraceae bacterium]